MDIYKTALLLFPLVALLACNNGKQDQAVEQQHLQDSIEQARLDSVERVRRDSLEQVRQDSIEKAVIHEKIAFLKHFFAMFDHYFNKDGMGSEDYVINNLSDFAYDQLDPMKGDPEEEGYHDLAYFLDGDVMLAGHQARVDNRKIAHVKGNWFKVNSRLTDETAPEDQQHYNTSFQVMVEDVDGRYLITKLKLN